MYENATGSKFFGFFMQKIDKVFSSFNGCSAPKPSNDGLGRLSSGQLSQRFPLLQQMQHWNAAYAKSRSEVWVVIRIDLQHCRSPCQHLGRLSHRRCE